MNNFMSVLRLSARNMRIYFRDKMAVFFSLLSPLIVLGLYILFLKGLQVDSLKEVFEGLQVSYKLEDLNFFIDSWMICSVLATAMVTVPLGAAQFIVTDKINRVDIDYSVTPIKSWQVFMSNVLAIVAISLIILLSILIIGMIYLAIATGQMFSILAILSGLGVMLLGIISSTTIVLLVTNFIKSEGAFSGLTIIVGTAIGFLIGAYMPLSMFPDGVQIATAFLPPTHVTTMIKSVMLTDIANLLPGAEIISEMYGLHLMFGAHIVPKYVPYIVVAASIVLFAAVDILVFKCKKKSK